MKHSKSLKHFVYIAFALIMLITSWESNRINAAVITPEIPKESIRLRILANSDSAQDQALKREIRDAIVAMMQDWAAGPQTLEEARTVVTAHLPEFDRLVAGIIKKRGYNYSHQVELGLVPFPTKMYGNDVYPAGDYEALRVIIGSGKGQNWWCVLFPPLCFVNSITGEAVAGAVQTTDGTTNQKTDQTNDRTTGQTNDGNNGSTAIDADQTDSPTKTEVRFFLWDLIEAVISWFK
ncbi:stage II sporulation protein R [Paenibacillus eucommiae]|uniref:Stage II sporulation protein R n=1 Tax=Paenibacillus eucommiae TaxID=1355755 RepID=A0ABS4IZS7_9BACL|nr:stage II sporulation protein R [Paenibacillus eucommiae]MBP1992575.1 stage II sporulation protein R [Paenibacillus eucommiae]